MPTPTLPTHHPIFTPHPPETITTTSWSLPEPAIAQLVLAAYTGAGFALVQGPTDPGPGDLQALSAALRLGAVFTPPLYQGSTHTRPNGISHLTATDPVPGHPFAGRAAQELHCDGTLQALGQIPTTLLLCVRPAASGGSTLLFDAPAAFAALHASDPEAAAQLTHEKALLRTSTLVADRASAGPAFGWRHGRLVTRYSLTETDSYHPLLPDDEPALRRALGYLRRAARPGSLFRCEFTLGAGQALILANDRLCHGRSAYQDQVSAPRLMLRALFTSRPGVRIPAQGEAR